MYRLLHKKDKERGSSGNVAKGAFLPCPLPSCNGHFEVPEVVDLLSSDSDEDEDEVEVVSSPVKLKKVYTSREKVAVNKVPSLYRHRQLILYHLQQRRRLNANLYLLLAIQ